MNSVKYWVRPGRYRHLAGGLHHLDADAIHETRHRGVFIFQQTDPRPAAPPREPLWKRYLRALTVHAARAGRRTAMRRAAAETITEHLVEEHGLGRRDDPSNLPTTTRGAS